MPANRCADQFKQCDIDQDENRSRGNDGAMSPLRKRSNPSTASPHPPCRGTVIKTMNPTHYQLRSTAKPKAEKQTRPPVNCRQKTDTQPAAGDHMSFHPNLAVVVVCRRQARQGRQGKAVRRGAGCGLVSPNWLIRALLACLLADARPGLRGKASSGHQQ